jgi:predicted nucleic acid-binding protein
MFNKYCFDTSAFIEPWNKHYPIRLLPQYWKNIANLIDAGRIFCPVEVYEEILKKDDSLVEWIKQRKEKLVHPITIPVQQKVTEILSRFPKLIKVYRNQSMADPWVIAHALIENAIVITKEIPGSNTDIKIPNVCIAYQLEYMDEIGLAEREKLLEI